jgi:hypothetical protein
VWGKLSSFINFSRLKPKFLSLDAIIASISQWQYGFEAEDYLVEVLNTFLLIRPAPVLYVGSGGS